jgi:hypothetical protein
LNDFQKPCSPGKEGTAFVFDKKHSKSIYHQASGDDEFLNASSINKLLLYNLYINKYFYLNFNFKGLEIPVPNSNSLDYEHSILQSNCDGDIHDDNQFSKVQVLPTVFKWDGMF